MAKKLTRSQIIRKLDGVFSEYIRLRDSDKFGNVICPLCGKKMFWKEAQNMHFVSRGILKYRYDENNCHAGCFRCNVILNGNYIVYTRRMQKKYSIEYVDTIINDKVPYTIPTGALLEMVDYYKNQKNQLLETKVFK